MRLVLNELRKILRPLRTLLVMLFIILFSTALIATYFTHTTTAVPLTDLYTLYGGALSEENRDEAQSRIEAMYEKKIDDAIKNEPWFQENGIIGYEKLKEIVLKKEDTPDNKLNEYENGAYDRFRSMNGGETANVFWVLISCDTVFKEYDECHTALHDESGLYWSLTDEMNEKEIERFDSIFSDREADSLLSQYTASSVMGSLGAAAVLIVLSLTAVLSPVITTDSMTNTNLILLSSKAGRGLYKKQLSAYMLTAFLLTTFEIAVYALIFFMSPASRFTDCMMNSFENLAYGTVYWVKGTLGQYLLGAAGLSYILAFACAAALFFVSCRGKNYISLLFRAIPAAAALAIICRRCLYYAFVFHESESGYPALYSLVPVKNIELYVSLALLAVCTAAVLTFLRSQKRKDIR